MNGLYLVTDQSLMRGRRIEDVVAAAVQGGAQYVQLREKSLSTRDFVDAAGHIKKLLAARGVPLIINDRVDIALAIEADGVHLGQDDLPYPIARRLLGPDALVGLSVETMEDVVQAEAYDVDYLGISPIFPTTTKLDTKGSWGMEGLSEATRRSRHPLVAIGGLNVTNAAEAIRAGADAVAVVSAICAAADPKTAAAELTAQTRGATAQHRNQVI